MLDWAVLKTPDHCRSIWRYWPVMSMRPGSSRSRMAAILIAISQRSLDAGRQAVVELEDAPIEVGSVVRTRLTCLGHVGPQRHETQRQRSRRAAIGRSDRHRGRSAAC